MAETNESEVLAQAQEDEIVHPKIAFFKAITDGLFRKLFALYLATGAGWFIQKAAFLKGKPSEVLLLTVGFVTGTVLTTLITFYFGTSQSSDDKTKLLKP